MKWSAGGWSLVAAALLGCSSQPPAVRGPLTNDPASTQFYPDRVQPIFQEHCFRCHGGWNRKGGLNFQTRTGLLKGGNSGPAVVPGDPAKSLLLRLMQHEEALDKQGKPMPMPPNKPKLSDADIDAVARWIEAGALMPQAAYW
ncbi:MAG: c-type cytochrome [Acidobacteriota bacterium]|nr:c-type cytochrome [Acidobacteriota bacterium]